MPSQDREAVELQQHREPDQRLHGEEDGRACDADLARRDRARARARDLGVEIAVEDVVPGAARAAHREGADEEQRRRCHGIGVGMPGARSPRGRPTTSTASAAATSRSGGRRARAAGKDGPGAARAYRPSFRSSWRRARRLSLIVASTLPVSVFIGAALRSRSGSSRCRRCAWCRAPRSGPGRPASARRRRRRRRCRPVLRLDGPAMVGLHCVPGLGRDAAPLRVRRMNLTTFDFGGGEALEHGAHLFARGLLLHRGLHARWRASRPRRAAARNP